MMIPPDITKTIAQIVEDQCDGGRFTAESVARQVVELIKHNPSPRDLISEQEIDELLDAINDAASRLPSGRDDQEMGLLCASGRDPVRAAVRAWLARQR